MVTFEKCIGITSVPFPTSNAILCFRIDLLVSNPATLQLLPFQFVAWICRYYYSSLPTRMMAASNRTYNGHIERLRHREYPSLLSIPLTSLSIEPVLNCYSHHLPRPCWHNFVCQVIHRRIPPRPDFKLVRESSLGKSCIMACH